MDDHLLEGEVAELDRLADDPDEQRFAVGRRNEGLAVQQHIHVPGDRSHDAVLHEQSVHRDALVELQNNFAVHHDVGPLLGRGDDEDLDRLSLDVGDDATTRTDDGGENLLNRATFGVGRRKDGRRQNEGDRGNSEDTELVPIIGESVHVLSPSSGQNRYGS